MTDLSRRHLIQGAVAAGAALAGSTVAVASPKQKWDEVVDVIVKKWPRSAATRSSTAAF